MVQSYSWRFVIMPLPIILNIKKCLTYDARHFWDSPYFKRGLQFRGLFKLRWGLGSHFLKSGIECRFTIKTHV